MELPILVVKFQGSGRRPYRNALVWLTSRIPPLQWQNMHGSRTKEISRHDAARVGDNAGI
jgi:hypothetical protein